MNGLFGVAAELQSFCDRQGWRCCFIGGLAVLRWGEPRVTRDVDLALVAGFGSEERFISPLLASYNARIEDAADFARRHRVLLLESSSRVAIDISLAAFPFEEQMIDRATPFEFETGLAIRTCSAEDLIVLKIFASRPIDIRDAESVALRHKGRLDWIYIGHQLRPLAEIKGDRAILEAFARLQAL